MVSIGTRNHILGFGYFTVKINVVNKIAMQAFPKLAPQDITHSDTTLYSTPYSRNSNSVHTLDWKKKPKTRSSNISARSKSAE
mmetsp:Transcript_123278/g.184374  ORF Transcript_123278/g.184374 Transcript_123278/m.184374 type:complete len:83 (+) Transcript_123278:291-539(+)